VVWGCVSLLPEKKKDSVVWGGGGRRGGGGGHGWFMMAEFGYAAECWHYV